VIILKKIKKIYHYTSKQNFDIISRENILEAKTKLPIDDLTLCNFVTGIPAPNHKGWEEYGLMPYLIEHAGGNVIFEIPIHKRRREYTLVREHALYSPKRFLELFSEDLWVKMYSGHVTKEDQEKITTCENEYISSTVPLNRYKGNFKAPEIWLPQDTYITELKLISL